MAIRKALNVIYNVQENRGYLALRGICTLYTILFLLALTLLLLAAIYSHQILAAVNQVFFDGSAADWLVRTVSFLISEAVFLLIFQCLYAFLPAKHQRFRAQLPGALFSSLTLNAVMTVYSWLTGREGVYSFYGSLRSVIILVLSIYILVFIVFLGAGINYNLTRKQTREPAPSPQKQTMRPFQP
jgi:membrane protein